MTNIYFSRYFSNTSLCQWRKNLLNKKLIPLLFLFASFLLAGCNSHKELEEYKNSMNTFYSDICEYNNIINAIDATSENSVKELLSALDNVKERFVWMASLPVPEEFSSIEILSDEAKEYMTNAVSLYHQAFKGDIFDPSAAETAKEYYDQANQRMHDILTILHGKDDDGGTIPYSESIESIE